MIIEILLAILVIVIFGSLVITGTVIGLYNTLRVAQQDIKTQWSNILTEYQRRADMFYNLVQATKSHKKFEQETLTAVTAARSGNWGSTKDLQMKSLKGLEGAMQRLMVVFERYPKLQSNEQHNMLMQEIRITEDRINIARTDYNSIVGDYNKKMNTFPNNLIAGIFRFSNEQFYVNEETTTSAPKIDLDTDSSQTLGVQQRTMVKNRRK